MHQICLYTVTCLFKFARAQELGASPVNQQLSTAGNLYEWAIKTLDAVLLKIHELLPIPVRAVVAKYVFVENYSDTFLYSIIFALVTIAIVQLKPFTRPKPVSLKQLPKRPIVTISFQPDDISNETMKLLAQGGGTGSAGVKNTIGNTKGTTSTMGTSQTSSRLDTGRGLLHRFSSKKSSRSQPKFSKNEQGNEQNGKGDFTETDRDVGSVIDELYSQYDDDDDSSFDRSDRTPKVDDFASYPFSRVPSGTTSGTATSATSNFNDLLPDSFAPLLSSSVVDVITDKLTADLIHALSASATVKLRPGTHEIPLDKDSSRPQLLFEVPASGCKIAAAVQVGSDGLTVEQDFNCTTTKNFNKDDGIGQADNTNLPGGGKSVVTNNQKTRNGSIPVDAIRSKPMVKSGGIVFDPPIPLGNVAPTLIHFPTLFEDLQYLPILRGVQIIRYFIDFIISISNFLEKCLWILETKCKIHLSQIRIRPLYKGSNKRHSTNKGEELPEWRLSLSFSGHVMLFGILPIPFVNIVLPSVIIPNPHALLEFLLSKQPLASARLKRENIAEQQIALAVIGMAESWKTDLKLVATPPAVGVDLTLPGGLGIAVEVGLWRDHQPGSNANSRKFGSNTIIVGAPPSVGMNHTDNAFDENPPNRRERQRRTTRKNGAAKGVGRESSKQDGRGGRTDTMDEFDLHSMSSWTTNDDSDSFHLPDASVLGQNRKRSGGSETRTPVFDANNMIPWKLEFSAKGSIRHEKMSFHVLKLEATHDDKRNPSNPLSSKFETRGSLAVWKNRTQSSDTKTDEPSILESNHRRNVSMNSENPGYYNHVSAQVPIRRRKGNSNHPELESEEDSPSVAAILLFPEKTVSFHKDLRILQYDYVFDVFEDSKIDAVTVSIGATHPMLNGGTMITTILDSVYAFGSFSARENAVLDPSERRRKRNVLRHLPATDFTFGIQNIFIPSESNSYSDDGQTLMIPEIDGGRMMVHVTGGLDTSDTASFASTLTAREAVVEGLKVVADFEIASCTLSGDSTVKEFPELDIFPGVKLRSLFSGVIVGSVKAHLRPQQLVTALTSAGPNVFNPLEAYEIDFSHSSLSVKVKEYAATLGHRRIMFPAESTFLIQVTESVVDMGFEGETKCELCWDFQGLSPILQVAQPGLNPENALPENRQQVTLLVAPLRQGRFSLNVNSVGGINITKAATSREDKEGLYDWKFFNALVSPDGESAGRIMDVLHDKRTMDRMLQILKLVNSDLHSFFEYSLQQFWRAKEILDTEGVVDAKDAIPKQKLSRLISLLLTGGVEHIDSVCPIVDRLVAGDGIDVVQVKVLLRDHIEADVYEDWAAEIDRVVRFLAVALGPSSSAPPYVEEEVIPLSEMPIHASVLRGIPSASQLYEILLNKPQLPLDPNFSNLVSRVAPYLSFRQIEYILNVRVSNDWQASDLRRIRYVYSIKRKVLEIAESYGGLSFLPQSFFLSVFLGEATRTSLRASNERVHSMQRTRSGPSQSVSADRRRSGKISTMNRLRRRRFDPTVGNSIETATVASEQRTSIYDSSQRRVRNSQRSRSYDLSDCLLGPQEVAILLQAGLTSVMKGSTVVQLNQRMLLDLIGSQPRSFAIAVLAEIGTSSRALTSALMALLELDQTAFKASHQIDMHSLLESWLPGLKVPRRDDYMAGGRFARQSYYGAIFAISKSILDDAESYMALKNHLQKVRKTTEKDPIPKPRDEIISSSSIPSKISETAALARSLIDQADAAGGNIMQALLSDKSMRRQQSENDAVIALYKQAFDACATVLSLDKHAFYAPWFQLFYRRNYDALQVKSVYENVLEDVDNVRFWMSRLWVVAKNSESDYIKTDSSLVERIKNIPQNIFDNPHPEKAQMLVDAIIESLIFERSDKDRLRKDPLVRLLIANDPGHYNIVIISAAGVVTEGKNGTELKNAFARLEKRRGVKVIRADTATARSLEYNASKIEEAIDIAVNTMKQPYGLLGYSQGCANALMAESLLQSGSPNQQQALTKYGGLICRQLLFSAANGSFHGPAMDRKIQSLIAMGEDFFKSQAGYFSRAFSASILETLTSILDSGSFHKLMGGAQSFLEDGCREFWREAQHLSHVPTCTLRGVEEEHTTPESLEMLSHMLSKQSGSHRHDSQVHVFDAVGHPVYHRNRNAAILKRCEIGAGAVQRTHHWSPLHDEVDFLTTSKDVAAAMFDCAKDRHVVPWLDVNVRFGFVTFATEGVVSNEKHPSKLISESGKSKLTRHKGGDEWENC